MLIITSEQNNPEVTANPIASDFIETLGFVSSRQAISNNELERLRNGGLEVSIHSIEFEHGLLAYKGHRVALYHKANPNTTGELSPPRYHFAACHNVMSFRKRPRHRNYFVCMREEGDRRAISEPQDAADATSIPISLDACRNCQKRTILSPKFEFAIRQEDLAKLTAAFCLAEFSRLCAPGCLRALPPDEYTSDWENVKAEQRKLKKWTCEMCCDDLSDWQLHRFLHVHHIDRMKQNNKSENLQLLCICCHARQPGHEIIANGSDYKKYLKIKVI